MPAVRGFIRCALVEDMGSGDKTSRALVGPDRIIRAAIISRGKCVVCGGEIARLVFKLVDKNIVCRPVITDGRRVRAGETLIVLRGRARSILAAERTALNFFQRLTGIATLTARFVAAANKYGTQILDTRKTTPNMRLLEKYAVRCGGGQNHRMGLYDMILIKDNHRFLCSGKMSTFFARKPYGLPQEGSSVAEVAMADEMAPVASQGSAKMPRGFLRRQPWIRRRLRRGEGYAGQVPRGASLADAVRQARRSYPRVPVEVEVESLAQLRDAMRASPGWILLDNMKPALIRKCVKICSSACRLEASGGINLQNIATIAATGVDAVSIGALTHSAPAADLSLEIYH